MLIPLTSNAMFSPDECAKIIQLAEAAGLTEAGLVRGRQNQSIRTARIAWLDEAGTAAWVFDRVMATVATANRNHFGFDLTEFAERVQVALYEASDDSHFDWHSDIGAGSFAQKRKLTLVTQLSDPASYEGGQLELNGTGQAEIADLKQGTATLFPSFVTHRVTRVTSGARYSLTTWVHGPAFR